ncbi:MAG: hypothetical protein M1822_005264 [Bathelium mastoideum]|nr:MAG: hypothetical protein M1822_005264 [Bathelium mastoideum]
MDLSSNLALLQPVPNTTTDIFPFATLPRELRDKIYDLSVDWNEAIDVFKKTARVNISGRKAGKCSEFQDDVSIVLATPTILLLNRQITTEALIIFRKKPLKIHWYYDNWGPASLTGLDACLPFSTFQRIPKIELTVLSTYARVTLEIKTPDLEPFYGLSWSPRLWDWSNLATEQTWRLIWDYEPWKLSRMYEEDINIGEEEVKAEKNEGYDEDEDESQKEHEEALYNQWEGDLQEASRWETDNLRERMEEFEKYKAS